MKKMTVLSLLALFAGSASAAESAYFPAYLCTVTVVKPIEQADVSGKSYRGLQPPEVIGTVSGALDHGEPINGGFHDTGSWGLIHADSGEKYLVRGLLISASGEESEAADGASPAPRFSASVFIAQVMHDGSEHRYEPVRLNGNGVSRLNLGGHEALVSCHGI